MARRLRRFKYTGLPKLTREQARVLNAMMSYVPGTAFEADFKDRLRAIIEPLVHADIDLWFDNVTVVEPGELSRHLCDPTCVAAIGMLPKQHTLLCEVDLTVAQQAIDRMLGGNAEDVDGQRALSEIEDGVFSFLLLKTLALVQEGFGSEHQLSLKLNGVYGGWDALAARVSDDTEWLCVGFKLFFDLAVGFVRLYVPREVVLDEFTQPAHQPGPAQTRVLRRLSALSPRIATIKVPIQVEVGRIPFAVDDIAALDAGDIVLVEDPTVRLVDGALSGMANCYIGGGNHGTIQGSLMVGDSGGYEVAIDQILPGAEPAAAGAVVQEAEMSEEMQSEEYAREVSRALPASDRVADGARARLSSRSGRRAAAALPTGTESPLDEEHSEGEYDEEEGGYEEESGYEEEEPMAESAGMLADVAVAMVVELGRVSVSAADVLALRPGQVIELSRSPGDPVDLVVDGKMLGKGELVEIEGELGVRILELVK
jgi:flagellar motor switch protein FliM